MARLRLPVSLLIVPSIVCGVFAVISGGVALTQGPNAVWWPCGVFLAGLAACAAVFFLAPIDWISDEELKAIEIREGADEIERQLRDGTFAAKSRRHHYLVLAGIVAIVVFRFLFDFGAIDVSGHRDGMTAAGLTLGVWHVLGRDWTGVELLFMGGLLIWLGYTLAGGFKRLGKAQNRD